ncbi:phosphonoacetaldehyde hydrolase [Dysgonomonas hofstadii]|uniref:Phosphonoacetaldehyde hydrolase n=1 Tax=Dysgonomonas hofstadii TaxID=637886 RepID=A0A840CFQ7_9BACT|nr:phosphonoacetaldehyde hydrolase [Dysgonomonas hofstadii]MBB4034827.1 phosphonoacetaldehyde hydrolase [Dysgonomonas hofstadii]
MSKEKQIECVVMDWAGTAIDFGCFAPVDAFVKAFRDFNIKVTTDEVRIPMGMAKIEHIRQLLRMSRVNSEFKALYDRDWVESDVVKLNQFFEKYLFSTLSEYTDPIPYVVDTLNTLRIKNIKIGSTTGYTRKMMDIVEPAAGMKGYVVDNCVTPDDLPMGRPAPFMIFRNMIDLNIQNPDCVVKVGDTVEDIREGINAKVWTVGVVMGSSMLGISEYEANEMPETVLTEKMNIVRSEMSATGAHYVIDSITELPQVIEQINTNIK